MSKTKRIIAILAVRNEELFMKRCLTHLFQQGIESYIIDNESTDNTVSIAEDYLHRGVIGIETYPYSGFYEWASLLSIKEKIANTLDADWFIHHDADEIRYAPSDFTTLYDGIMHADSNGYTAVNFDEFVFLPTSCHESYEGKDYVKEMIYYYFFEPKKLSRVNAWKNMGQKIDLVSSGGHVVNFLNRKIYPRNFIMRHYLALSHAHACKKYGNKLQYKSSELKRGWHLWRSQFNTNRVTFPNPKTLQRVDNNIDLNTIDPWKYHPLFGANPIANIKLKTLQKIKKFLCKY